jgi:hypothetical protein
MTVVTTVRALVVDDVKAFRVADSVGFFYYNGQSYIRLYLGSVSGTDNRIYTATEQRLFPITDSGTQRFRMIECGVSIQGFGENGHSDWSHREAHSGTACFALISSAQYRRTWSTVVGLLRTGDTLQLDWIADANSAVIREADLHADELQVTVSRGERTMDFVVDHRIGADNSARMIRRYG